MTEKRFTLKMASVAMEDILLANFDTTKKNHEMVSEYMVKSKGGKIIKMEWQDDCYLNDAYSLYVTFERNIAISNAEESCKAE